MNSGQHDSDRQARKRFERFIDGVFSAPPADRLAACEQIRARLLIAPFSSETKTLGTWARLGGPERYIGQPHPTQPSTALKESTELNSLDWHVLKHTVDGTWVSGTTPAEYLHDLREAVRAATRFDCGRERRPYVGSYASRTFTLVGVRADTMTPAKLQAFTRIAGSLDRVILVVYDATQGRGVLMTAYAMSASEAEERMAKWESRITL